MSDQEYLDKIKLLSEDLELIAHITSHTLRDPIRQAQIDCEALAKTTQEEATRNGLDIINQQLENVLQHIKILREYSYLANFDKPLVAVDGNAVLQGALAALAEVIAAKHAVVKADSLPMLLGYQEHLVLLFKNIIHNAVVFNESPQPQVIIACKDAGTHWRITFTDNGIGLPEVYRKLVFALFQGLHAEEGYRGAGLAFCKKIVENHGGSIGYTSDGKSGTCFFVELRKV